MHAVAENQNPTPIGERILDELEKVIVGQRETLRMLMATVLSGGHVLLEDRPGVGKTVLARSLGSLFGLELSRVQGTPDLLPTDITGVHIFNPESREWEFRSGPIFAPLLLVDELNRATAKAQSALLEGMAERQVTVEGETMQLPSPFVVIATQNPHGDAGTYRLGAAQLDRFATQLSMGLPERDAERQIVAGHAGARHSQSIRALVSPADIPTLFAATSSIKVSDPLIDYVLDVIASLRLLDPEIWLSVRVSETLLAVSQGLAYMHGRAYVAPEDIQAAALPVVRHRIPLRIGDELIGAAIKSPPVPVHTV